jgi:hypothetical protein
LSASKLQPRGSASVGTPPEYPVPSGRNASAPGVLDIGEWLYRILALEEMLGWPSTAIVSTARRKTSNTSWCRGECSPVLDACATNCCLGIV